jgi:transmembrane sensor
MARDTEMTSSIVEQAAHWWAILRDEDASPADHREFAEWLMRSPERVEAYLQVTMLQRGLGSPKIRWPATQADVLIREANAAPEEAVPMWSSSAARPDSGSRGIPAFRMRFAVTLAAALLISIGVGWYMLTSPEQYTTRFGEQRSVLLDDGSRITLNTTSKIEVELRKGRRLVHLVQGQALFDVTHDPARPFDVTTQNAVMRVLGTQFDVDARASHTTITVVHGRVGMVSPSGRTELPILTAADRLVIDARGRSTVQHGVDLRAALAWTQRKLIFQRRPLAEVAEEFNRYNRDRIEIRDESLRAREISGVFQSNDVSTFLIFLANIPGVVVQTDGAGTHVVTVDENSESDRSTD